MSKDWLVRMGKWIGITLLGLFVALLLFKITFVVVIASAVSAAVAVLIWEVLKKKGSSASKDPRDENKKEGSPDQASTDKVDVTIPYQELLALNIRVRERGVAPLVLVAVESIIDTLRELLPELNERHSGNELTWVVNKMATDYLGRVVNTFAQLPEEDQQAHQEELLKSLKSIDAEVRTIKQLVREQKVGEFRTKAAFIRARFLNNL